MQTTTTNPLEAAAEAGWRELLERIPAIRLALSESQLSLARLIFNDGFAQGGQYAIIKMELPQ